MAKINVVIEIPDEPEFYPISDETGLMDDTLSEEELKEFRQELGNDVYERVKRDIVEIITQSEDFNELFIDEICAEDCETYEDYGISVYLEEEDEVLEDE